MFEERRERGEIVAVEEGVAVVRLPDERGGICRGCGLCLAAAAPASEGACRVLRLPCPPGLEAGAEVEVALRRPTPAVAAGLLFGLPTLGAGVLACLARLLAGPDAVGWMLAGGAAGLAAGLLPAVLLERRWLRSGSLDARILT